MTTAPSPVEFATTVQALLDAIDEPATTPQPARPEPR